MWKDQTFGRPGPGAAPRGAPFGGCGGPGGSFGNHDLRRETMASGGRPAFVAATRPIYKKWIAGPGGAYIRQVVEAADE